MSIRTAATLAASTILILNANAASGDALCKQLGLNPSSKAGKQWEKVFANVDKLKDIGADKFAAGDQKALLDYLVDHAADSDHPTVPGK